MTEREGVHYQAWGLSFVLHGLLLGSAALVSTQVAPVIKEEVFRWDVALVQTAPDALRVEAPQPVPVAQVSKASAVRTSPTPQPVPPEESASDVTMTRVASPYSPEVVPPTVAPIQPDPVQEIVGKASTVEPHEGKQEAINKEKVTPQDVVKPEPLPGMVYTKSQPVERQDSKDEIKREESAVQPVPVAVNHSATVAESPSPSRPHHAESVPVIHHESPSPEEMAPEWQPLVTVREGTAGAATAPSSSAVSDSTPAETAPVQSQSSAPLVAGVAPARPATKADNAWLAESLGRRIRELNRYPSSARLNGWEGKVVLRVVLRADGHLAAVTVHRSSGHEALDRAAMETVRLACPIHMKQALSAAEVAVYVPIVYSLAG
ncbi:MAG: TonB family protein [Nitrospira sp.]